MFLWTRPLGLRVFNQSKDKAEASAVLAANQGVYNGFLVAGLLWGLFASDPVYSGQILVFFLGCVSVAGVYGGYSVNKRIFVVQAAPALIALGLFFLT